MKGDLVDKIKAIFQNSRMEPPEEVWDNIDRELDLDASWETIEHELDIDKVWEGIDHTLANDAKGNLYDGVSKANLFLAILLWLGSVGLPMLPFSLERGLYNEEKESAYTEDVSIANPSHEILRAEDYFEQKAKGKNNPTSDRELSGISERANSLNKEHPKSSSHLSATPRTDNEVQKENGFVARIYGHDLKSEETTVRETLSGLEAPTRPWPSSMVNPRNRIFQTSLNSIISHKTKEENSSSIKMSKWFYGMGISWNISWINDPRYRRAKENTGFDKVLPSSSVSVQFQGGYRLHNHWSLYGGIEILGDAERSFSEYSNGDFIKGNTTIRYFGSYLSLRRTYKGLVLHDKLEKALFVGPYFNKITTVSQSSYVYGEDLSAEESLTDNFKPLEWGGVVGYELLYPFPKYQLGLKLSYRVGLNNIYQGSVQIPAYLRRTTVSGLQLHLFLRR